MQDGSTAADATEELKAALAELLLLQLIEAGDALTADVPPAETAKPRRASRLIRSELVSA